MTLIRHELKRAWKSTTIWTCAIGAFIVICLFMYPEMKSQTDSRKVAEPIETICSKVIGHHVLIYFDCFVFLHQISSSCNADSPWIPRIVDIDGVIIPELLTD